MLKQKLSAVGGQYFEASYLVCNMKAVETLSRRISAITTLIGGWSWLSRQNCNSLPYLRFMRSLCKACRPKGTHDFEVISIRTFVYFIFESTQLISKQFHIGVHTESYYSFFDVYLTTQSVA